MTRRPRVPVPDANPETNPCCAPPGWAREFETEQADARYLDAHPYGRTPMKIRVYGRPIPQGSAKAFAIRKAGVPTGRVAVTHDNPRTKPWRQAIVDEVREQLADPGAFAIVWAGQQPDHPLAVTVTFWMPRPRDHYGTGRNAARVRDGAPPLPTAHRDDVDKLARAVLDALTDAGLWRDDGQVCDLNARKRYATPDDPPGAMIEVVVCGA